jgi:hypothetical protein
LRIQSQRRRERAWRLRIRWPPRTDAPRATRDVLHDCWGALLANQSHARSGSGARKAARPASVILYSAEPDLRGSTQPLTTILPKVISPCVGNSARAGFQLPDSKLCSACRSWIYGRDGSLDGMFSRFLRVRRRSSFSRRGGAGLTPGGAVRCLGNGHASEEKERATMFRGLQQDRCRISLSRACFAAGSCRPSDLRIHAQKWRVRCIDPLKETRCHRSGQFRCGH